MDAEQETLRNPLGLDESCQNSSVLADCREQVVHGYGDVGADIVVVGSAPTEGAEATGIPFTGDDIGQGVQALLGNLGGVTDSPPTADHPEIENAYLAYLTRCRHPDRAATAGEIGRCDPFLNAEVGMINPEVLIPVGERALQMLVATHTTPQEPPAIEEAHATEIQGRGFLLVPMCDPTVQTGADRQAWLDTMGEVLEGDYRQPKGRRRQRERTERSRREGSSDTDPDP